MQDVFKNLRRVFDAVGRKVTPYEPNKELVPGITSVATPGHTPGHNSHVIASGSSKVYVQGDVTHVPFCSCAILIGTPSTTRTARWPRKRAARSTTCWSPRR